VRILVSNDDGIHAPGLWALAKALRDLGDLLVVAPDREQSGVGCGITLHNPIRAREVTPEVPGVPTYAVEGTPADSVILGLESLAGGPVDLVVAGINAGSNCGHDVFFSGTVGAALQGHFRGLPAIAVSVTALKDVEYGVASALARVLAGHVLEGLLPRDVLLNVNVPNKPLRQLKGIALTRMGRRSYLDIVKEGHDGKRKYYWLERGKMDNSVQEGTDVWAVRHDYVSVTPVFPDMTPLGGILAAEGLDDRLFQELSAALPTS